MIGDQMGLLSIPTEWLVMLFLIFMGSIFWAINKKIGFQILYLTILSMAIAHIITFYVPYIYTNEELVPITHLNVQTIVTFFAFFVPLARNRMEVLLCLTPPIIISLIHLIFLNTHVFSLVGGIVIGGFIIYSFFHTLDWIGGMPEPYILAFAIILPLFIAAIIYPLEDFLLYPGILLGVGIGGTLESFKVRLNVKAQTINNKVIAVIIGSIGILLFFGTDRLIHPWIPLPAITIGLVVGLWITFITPAILIALNIYTRHSTRSSFL